MLKKAEHPFQFVTAAYLTLIGNQLASNLEELHQAIEICSEASIFHHTFQSLERHHVLAVGFANDFAQWVLAALNCGELAERLGALDLRSYLALSDLRADLLCAIGDFCRAHPLDGTRPAFEPFYFCESVEVTVPCDFQAWTLPEFLEGLKQLTSASFHFHFLVSRLRLQLQSNDFSQWFARELGLESLAQRVNHIDVYSSTLEDAKARLEALVVQEMES